MSTPWQSASDSPPPSPDSADHQRGLCASYDRIGDLQRALGQGEPARQAYESSLFIIDATRHRRARPH